MARRRRDDDSGLIELLVTFAGLIVLLAFISPTVRNFIPVLGAFAIWILSILVAIALGILMFKSFRQKQNHALNTKLEDPYRLTRSTTERRPIEPQAVQHRSPAILVDQFHKIDWFQFEKLVGLVYEKQGYQVTRRGGANPDGGVDLIIERDGQKTAIQCKQWKTWNVGVKAVREFLGALKDTDIDHGIFITLNGYTGDAKQMAEKHGIELVNEAGLLSMLENLNINEDPRVLELVNDPRKYCPKCERLMVERVAEKGPNPGQRFWGCSGYPKCRFTMPLS
jgi:hypothetical protein